MELSDDLIYIHFQRSRFSVNKILILFSYCEFCHKKQNKMIHTCKLQHLKRRVVGNQEKTNEIRCTFILFQQFEQLLVVSVQINLENKSFEMYDFIIQRSGVLYFYITYTYVVASTFGNFSLHLMDRHYILKYSCQKKI